MRDIDSCMDDAGLQATDASIRCLWLAVFQVAVSDLAAEVKSAKERLRSSRNGKRASVSPDIAVACPTWDWVMSDRRSPTAFVGLCTICDLNPEAVRMALKRRFFE